MVFSDALQLAVEGALLGHGMPRFHGKAIHCEDWASNPEVLD